MAQMLSTNEYAEIMGFHPQAVRSMCEKGSINCVKAGGRWRIPWEENPEPTIDASVVEALDKALAEVSAGFERAREILREL